MKKVFITGASGHLGCNTVREAVKKGYSVKAMVRKTSDLRGLKGSNLEICYGDVLDKNSLVEGSRGCDAVVHLAANYSFFVKDRREISAPALEGTRNIFEAAHQNAIERIVYTSSVGAVGWTDDPEKVLTTNDWLPPSSTLEYFKAKRDSEQLAWELSGKYGIPMISLLPGNILGRLDYSVTRSNVMVVEMLKGRGIIIEMTFSFADVRDVARIHTLAIENGRTGTRYFIAPPAISMKLLGQMVRKLAGKNMAHIPTSRRMNIWMGKMMETVAKMTNSTPILTGDLARAVSHRYANFDMKDTITDFQYEPTPFEETVKDTINWFTFLGYGKLSKKYASQFVPEPDWVK